MVSFLINVILGMQIMNYMVIVPEIILNTFKEYPYLHSPTIEEKKDYIGWFARHKKSMLVVSTKDEKIAGFITGIPMKALRDYIPSIEDLCTKNSIKIKDCYYCGDVIVLPDFQKQGVCSALFSAFENKVASMGYKCISLITSVREADHPLKPKNYRDPEAIWEHYGFRKTSLVITNMQPTVIDAAGTVKDIENSFIFWVKEIQST